ncbi:MAG: ribonuclease PH [Pseudomonadota bacterium]|nr:ribonuclease PH [Pseudomonadota bacterium]
MRPSKRSLNDLRQISLETGVSKHAEGSCMIKFGHTQVLCTASVEGRVPPFLRNTGSGWITAEYGMLPRSTHTRTDREAARGKQSGRTLEIQRLIGRSLRAVANLDQFGERQVRLDCDVLQADGGTRTASITGAYVALHQAFEQLRLEQLIEVNPLFDQVAAISCGVVDGQVVVDLDYEEDSSAEVDANFVLCAGGGLIEVQASGEGGPFTREQFNKMLALAENSCLELFACQRVHLATK